MPTKIYHPDHGIVFSGDNREIKALLDKGGKIITKEQDNGKAEETTKTEVLEPKPHGDSMENIETNVSKAKKLKRYGDK